MKYRLLGNSGLRVSEISLGTMTFGEDWGWGTGKEEARKIYEALLGQKDPGLRIRERYQETLRRCWQVRRHQAPSNKDARQAARVGGCGGVQNSRMRKL